MMDQPKANVDAWPSGDGEMATCIRGHDWAATPLGPVEGWPDRLKAAVDNLLASGFPGHVWWGPELVQLYNDAALAIMRAKHPALLGRPARTGWSEIWPELAPLVERVLSTGLPETREDLPLLPERGGVTETAYFTVSLSALRDGSGAVAGTLATAIETTERVRAEARLRESEERQAFLLKLSDALQPLADPKAIQAAATKLLRERLDAGWCYYVEWDEARGIGVVLGASARDGLPSLAGVHDVSDLPEFMAGLRTGEMLNVPDYASSELFNQRTKAAYGAIGVRALSVASLVKSGRLVAGLAVADTKPKAWPESDTALIQETAERMWEALERARAEAALRESEVRQAFLLALSDALRPLSDTGQIQETAARLLGQHLGAVRVHYAEALEDENLLLNGPGYVVGVPQITGLVRISDFDDEAQATYRAGQTLVIPDVEAGNRSEAQLAAFRALGIRAALGVPLAKAGRLIGILSVHHAEPHNWTPAERMLVEQTAERTWEALERARAEAALRESEAKHRSLFETMGQGYVECELIRSVDGQAIDYRMLEANAQYERLTGVARENALGRTAREIVPGLEQSWIDTFDRIVREGGRESFELPAAGLGRWFEIHAYPRGPDRFAILYDDITERKRGEAALRQTEERQRFLLALGDAMRAQPTAQAIIEVAARLLGERLNPSRVLFAEFDETNGLVEVLHAWLADGAMPFPVVVRQEDFAGPILDDLRAGRTLRVDDAGDPAFARPDLAALTEVGIKAALSVPLIIGGRLVATLSAHQHAPRRWADDEVSLLQEVAERLWADVVRARTEAALRQSERRLAAELAGTQLLQRLSTRLIPEQSPEVLHEQILDAALELMQADAVSIQLLDESSQRLRRIAARNLHLESTEYWTWVDASHASTCGQALRTNSRVIAEDVEASAELAGTGDLEAFRRSGTRAVQSTPLASRSGRPIGMISTHWREPRRLAEVDFSLFDILARQVADLLERSQTEAALRSSEERQAFLLRLADALRPLAEPAEVQAAAARVLGEHLGVDRAFFCEVGPDENHVVVHRDHTSAGTASFAGRWRLSDFGALWAEGYRAGRTLATAGASEVDGARAEAFEASGFRACVGVPVNKGGRLVGILVVHSARPREWTPLEVAFVEETAERTWAAVERTRAEEALRESEERLRSALSLDTVGVLFWDDAFRLSEANEAFLRMTGFSSEEALGKTWQELTPREFHPASERAVDELAARGEITPYEKQYFRRDGSRWWGLFAMRKLQRGAVEYVLDITGRKETEAALRDSEERFRQFSEASPDVLWIRSIDALDWEFLSPAFERIYGLDRATALADGGLRNWLDLIVPEDRDYAAAQIGRVQQGERVEFEYRIRRPVDGELRWLRDSDFPLLDASGSVQRIGGIGHDITDEKRIADRLTVLVAELQHRTRNLLNVIRSVAARTLANSTTLEDFRDQFEDRLRALARVNGLLSRLEEGDRITFDELLRTELSGHGLSDLVEDGAQVHLEGPGGVSLPSATVQTFALALHELMTNAVKYGALSSTEGRLEIQWGVIDVEGEPRLRVDWQESGVSVDGGDGGGTPRSGSGYGRELIERALPYQLRAESSYDLGPDGLRCVVIVPVSTTFGGSDGR